MPLHIDARPKTLDEFFGNKVLVESLKSLIRLPAKDRPHTYLFQGQSGCGKTTLARITARAFNIDEQSVIEINASESRGIDTVREVISQSIYLPINGQYKAYIWDECHKLTGDAQNAMLKLLEDYPKHCYFFLCTTNPEGVLKTVRGRCTTYQVENLRPGQIRDLIIEVCKKFGIILQSDIIELIIEASSGVPREALKMVDQVADIDDIEKAGEIILSVINAETDVINLCRAIYNSNDFNKIIEIYIGIANKEPESIRRAILGYMKSIAINDRNFTNKKIAIQKGVNFLDNLFDAGEFGLINMIYNTCLKN